MTEADVMLIAEIDAASNPTPWSLQQWQTACEPLACEHLIGQQANLVHVHRVGQGIVAFSAWQRVLDECELLNIAVSPEHRRKGIAIDFLSTSLAQWGERGVKTVFLEVRASNLAAQTLYARLGFMQNGLRQSYYKATATTAAEDAVLMQLNCAKQTG